MQLPLAVLRAGSEQIAQPGYTRNISSAGVLFTSVQEQGPGEAIEYVITLLDGARQVVNLRCVGKVIRCESSPNDDFQVAATLERYEFIRSN